MAPRQRRLEGVSRSDQFRLGCTARLNRAHVTAHEPLGLTGSGIVAREDLVIRIAGEAGEGVLITGQMVTQATARAGYYVLTDSVPPAEIKGGYSFYQIRLGEKRLRARGDLVDVLLAFNQEAFDNSIEHLRAGGILIFDSAELNPPSSDRYRSYAVPLTDIAKNQVELTLAKNMVAVGVVAGLFGLDPAHIHRLLRESKLAKK